MHFAIEWQFLVEPSNAVYTVNAIYGKIAVTKSRRYVWVMYINPVFVGSFLTPRCFKCDFKKLVEVANRVLQLELRTFSLEQFHSIVKKQEIGET